MTRIECPGLDGSNPLDFLASIGLFRLACRLWPNSEMSWCIHNGTWHPEYTVEAEARVFSERVSEVLLLESKASSPKEVLAAGPKGKDIKSAEDALKSNVARAREQAKTQGIQKRELDAFVESQQAVRDARQALQSLQSAKALYLERLSESLGFGIAHYGDIISVPLNVVRNHAIRAVTGVMAHGMDSRDAFIAEQLSALGTEMTRDDGAIQPCPFSFSNGQGGQLLLKNFRDCGQMVTCSVLNRWLAGEIIESKNATSLNWNPSDRNDYALRWSDPGKSGNSSEVDYTRNALGFVGLGMLTCVPVSSEQIASICWNDGFFWGVWNCSLGIGSCRSLLAQIGPTVASTLKRRGMADVFFSERLRVGAPPATRFYFSPSRSL